MQQLENLWRVVEEFCTNYQTGDISESMCIHLPQMNEVQRFKFNTI